MKFNVAHLGGIERHRWAGWADGYLRPQ